MRSPGDILVGFRLSVACQPVRLELLASPLLPEKDSPPHRAPRATGFATRGQPMTAGKVGYTT